MKKVLKLLLQALSIITINACNINAMENEKNNIEKIREEIMKGVIVSDSEYENIYDISLNDLRKAFLSFFDTSKGIDDVFPSETETNVQDNNQKSSLEVQQSNELINNQKCVIKGIAMEAYKIFKPMIDTLYTTKYKTFRKEIVQLTPCSKFDTCPEDYKEFLSNQFKDCRGHYRKYIDTNTKYYNCWNRENYHDWLVTLITIDLIEDFVYKNRTKENTADYFLMSYLLPCLPMANYCIDDDKYIGENNIGWVNFIDKIEKCYKEGSINKNEYISLLCSLLYCNTERMFYILNEYIEPESTKYSYNFNKIKKYFIGKLLCERKDKESISDLIANYKTSSQPKIINRLPPLYERYKKLMKKILKKLIVEFSNSQTKKISDTQIQSLLEPIILGIYSNTCYMSYDYYHMIQKSHDSMNNCAGQCKLSKYYDELKSEYIIDLLKTEFQISELCANT